MNFTLTKYFFDFQDTLYILKRKIRETSMPEKYVNEYKEYLGCDTVLKKEGIYYFVNKVEEAKIIEDTLLELDTQVKEQHIYDKI